MSDFDLLIQHEAQADIESGLNWYLQKDLEVAKAFLNELDISLQVIQGNPRRWPPIKKGIRRLVMRHFPFAIFYIINNQSILVIAVYHHRRNEKQWSKRSSYL